MKGKPFTVFSWNEDFLEGLRQFILKVTNGHPGKAVVVFPNKRPRRHLIHTFLSHMADEGSKPMLLPRILDGEAFARTCSEGWGIPCGRQASTLDQVAILSESVRKAAARHRSLSILTSLVEDMGTFYPWGAKLAGLMQECDAHMVDFSNISETNGDTFTGELEKFGERSSFFSALLLENIASIAHFYHAAMKTHGLTTPGMVSRRAAEMAASAKKEGRGLTLGLQDKTIIFAGFVLLSGAEDLLFRTFWEQGARVCLHSDPRILRSCGWHWSCQDHRDWQERWHAGMELWPCAADSSWTVSAPCLHTGTHEQSLSFFAGYDLHSQLSKLNARLSFAAAACHDTNDGKKNAAQKRRAVILSHDSLLMPVLHHVPDKTVNISLGCPLQRFPLAQLMERVLQTAESTDGQECVHWKELLALLRHSCLQMLQIPCDDGNTTSIRPFLQCIEACVLNGERMIPLSHLSENGIRTMLEHEKGIELPLDAAKAAPYIQSILAPLTLEWQDIHTLRDIGERVGNICRMLLEYGMERWKSSPLNAECLSRLVQSVAPSLSGSLLANTHMPKDMLFSVFRQEIAGQRVPFDADPIEGLQVLGMLETRLLQFEEVHILDLTEDALPGEPARDPLLPEALRKHLHLPDSGKRDRLAAHTFHSLLAGAKTVNLYWQEGVQSGDKKTRSRFVEEQIWQWEKSRGRLMKPQSTDKTSPLEQARFPLPRNAKVISKGIQRTAAINSRIEEFLYGGGVSPSALNTYVNCPRRFFLQYICNIKELRGINEDDDHAAVGVLVHRVLKEAFSVYKNRALPDSEDIRHELATKLTLLFKSRMEANSALKNLPPQSFFMLKHAGPLRLRNYVRDMPPVKKLLALEQPLECLIALGEHCCRLIGQVDRIDMRDGGLVILDYKTGKSVATKPSSGFWKDEVLWDTMRNWHPGFEGQDPMAELARQMKSVQLPFYIYLAGHDVHTQGQAIANAAIVELAQNGKESPLFDSKMDDGFKETVIRKHIPELILFILKHMVSSTHLAAVSSKACEYCPYAAGCRK